MSVLRRSPTRAYWLAILVFAGTWFVYAWLVPIILQTWDITGDEPHYMLAAHSLAIDGDLDLRNNYEQNDYRAFYTKVALDRHVSIQPDGTERLTHDIGLVLAITPAYAIGGHAGVMHFFAIVGALLAVQMFFLGWEVSGQWWGGLLAGLALAIAAPLANYVLLIYPEVIGGLLVLWALRVILNTPAWRQSPISIPLSRDSDNPPDFIANSWRVTSLGLAIAALPWLSGRFAPLLAFLTVLTVWKFWRQRSVWAVIGGITGLSMLIYLAVNFNFYGGPTPSATVAGSAVQSGFGNIAAHQIGRGLAGWLLDQQRGLLVYGPIFLLSFPGWLHLWRVRRMDGLLLGIPFLLMWLLASIWGGFYIAWEISARFLIVGLPLLAAPLAALFTGVGRWRRIVFWPLATALVLFSTINALVVFVKPFVPYHQSPVQFYEEAFERLLRPYFPALGTRYLANPADGASEWQAAAGTAQFLHRSEGVDQLSIGWYNLYGQAQFAPGTNVQTTGLIFDVSSSEDGRALLHTELPLSEADPTTGVLAFAIPFFNPYYDKWSFPFYFDIQTTGASDVRLSPILFEPDPLETNKRVAAWLGGIGLLTLAFGITFANRSQPSQTESIRQHLDSQDV